MSGSTISNYLWPGKVHFGEGSARLLAQESKFLGGRHCFLIADPGVVKAGLVEPLAEKLKDGCLAYTIYDEVESNPSMASVHRAAEAFRGSGAGVIVGIGGGSSLDTAKAVKLLSGGPAQATIWEYATMLGDDRRSYPLRAEMAPYIAIPTTAGTGAEVTPWAVITHAEKKEKFGVGNSDTIPDVALVDPALTFSLPPHLTAATGMDALSHLIEAYVSTNVNPVLDPMILYGIHLIARSLRPAVARGDDHLARRDMMEASMIGGIAISSKWLGACHSLAHPLSGLADVHHGLACAIMLPHQMRYSCIGAMERYAEVNQALRQSEVTATTREAALGAAVAVEELMADLGLAQRLQEVGVTDAMIPELAKAAFTDLNWWTNPRQLNEQVMADLYRKAF